MDYIHQKKILVIFMIQKKIFTIQRHFYHWCVNKAKIWMKYKIRLLNYMAMQLLLELGIQRLTVQEVLLD